MITSEAVSACSLCKFKAYLLLNEIKIETTNEYSSIMEDETKKKREEYIRKIQSNISDATTYSIKNFKCGVSTLLQANILFKNFRAYADVLTKVEHKLSKIKNIYEPTIIVGTDNISKEQKIYLCFAGYVLSKIHSHKVLSGRILCKNNKSHLVKFEHLFNEIELYVNMLSTFDSQQLLETPRIILNNHCQICQFKEYCETESIKNDHISLLSKISTEKQIQKYERKGIFTVNQLSYLYRPRRQRKRSKNAPSLKHSLELQALVMRIGKIYLHLKPEIIRSKTEIYLDIEGLFGNLNYYYLIGLIIFDDNQSHCYSFWADNSVDDEKEIWLQLVYILDKHTEGPIYHYGSYEAKAIVTLGKRYKTDTRNIEKRLVNVNSYIFGKIYFPLRSNSLKDIGKFIGASWSEPDASGLQSLVWRYYWDNLYIYEFKQKLVTYNLEDCHALKLLVDYLANINNNEAALLDIDCFVHAKKSRNNKVKNPVHQRLEEILKFAHADYDKNKISFSDDMADNKTKKPIRTKILKKFRRITKVIINNSVVSSCRDCGNNLLVESKKKDEIVKVDLVFTKNSIRKSVIKYISTYLYCKKCKRYYKSFPSMKKGRPAIYGYGFKIWIVYQRVSHRLPYQSIITIIEDMFNETLYKSLITDCLKEIANIYTETEYNIFQKLLASPFLHVDESPVNIDHINQYVWVFTDGKNVVYKFTKTRDALFIHEMLSLYDGVLISDFYSGYDSLGCKHQKCLVHIIRDLNNDLWSNPFDLEYGLFVNDVKELIIPIMETIQKYGLKAKHLNKYNLNQ